MKTICIASDHRGFKTKEKLKEELIKSGYDIFDVGTFSEERTDGYKFAKLGCDAVLKNPGSFGVLICGTGIAMSMAASKIKGIRAGQVYNSLMAQRAREHNNLNMLCFGAEIQNADEIYKLIESFDEAEFLGGEYQRRIDEIEKLK